MRCPRCTSEMKWVEDHYECCGIRCSVESAVNQSREDQEDDEFFANKRGVSYGISRDSTGVKVSERTEQ